MSIPVSHSIRPLMLGLAVTAATTACKSPAEHVREADEQVFAILEAAMGEVSGTAKTFELERRGDRLRDELLRAAAEAEAAATPLVFDIPTALDVAAGNSREFARQKESLYRAALGLTRQQHEFAVRWGAGGSAEVSGVGDDSADFRFHDDLAASVRSTSGARVVAGFANTLFRSLISGGGWNESSVLDLSFTQPLLQGFGEAITREPLTQAERDVVYAVRSFERFRATFAVDLVVSYLRVLQQEQNLANVRANYESVRLLRERAEALFERGRVAILDVDRARSDEYEAQNSIVDAETSLEAALDSFKFQLGLPIDTPLALDSSAFRHFESLGILAVELDEDRAVELAAQRRYDYRTTLDRVDDAARQIVVAEDALRSILDFSAAVSVPTEPGKALEFDWSRIGWAAGFDLDLALDKLPERNAYRTALINLDERIRAREEAEDRLAQEVRNALRDIRSQVASFRIQTRGLELAQARVRSTELLYEAGRIEAREVLDAQNRLLSAQISVTSAVVNYATARLELLRDLEAIALEPKGLRIDLTLPVPTGPQDTIDAARVRNTTL